MKAYVVTTGAIFAALTLVHIARLVSEGMHPAKDPSFILITIATAAMTVWSFRLLRKKGK
jgi:hypothetical protein